MFFDFTEQKLTPTLKSTEMEVYLVDLVFVVLIIEMSRKQELGNFCRIFRTAKRSARFCEGVWRCWPWPWPCPGTRVGGFCIHVPEGCRRFLFIAPIANILPSAPHFFLLTSSCSPGLTGPGLWWWSAAVGWSWGEGAAVFWKMTCLLFGQMLYHSCV